MLNLLCYSPAGQLWKTPQQGAQIFQCSFGRHPQSGYSVKSNYETNSPQKQI